MAKNISELQDSGGIDAANDLLIVRRVDGSPRDYKVTFQDLVNAVRATLVSGITYGVTIASGQITVDPLQPAISAYHLVDTEASAATDDLVTINGGKQGQLLTLQSTNDARDVTLKDNTGNLRLAGDFTLSNTADTIQLIYNSTSGLWFEVSRSDNG